MCRAKCAIFKRTDGLAGVLADFLEVLGGGVLVLAAVLGDVAGDLGGVVGYSMFSRSMWKKQR